MEEDWLKHRRMVNSPNSEFKTNRVGMQNITMQCWRSHNNFIIYFIRNVVEVAGMVEEVVKHKALSSSC